MEKPDSRTPKKRRSGVALTRKERRAAMGTFLEVFAQTANVSLACKAANVSRSTVYYWREHDFDDFGKRWNVAEQEANDAIEAEIHRRAIDGVNKPVVYQGEISGVWVDEAGNQVSPLTPEARLVPLTVKEYSDVLLIFYAKARMPHKYRERVEHTGAAGGPIQVEDARRKLYDLLMAQRGDGEDEG